MSWLAIPIVRWPCCGVAPVPEWQLVGTGGGNAGASNRQVEFIGGGQGNDWSSLAIAKPHPQAPPRLVRELGELCSVTVSNSLPEQSAHHIHGASAPVRHPPSLPPINAGIFLPFFDCRRRRLETRRPSSIGSRLVLTWVGEPRHNPMKLLLAVVYRLYPETTTNHHQLLLRIESPAAAANPLRLTNFLPSPTLSLCPQVSFNYITHHGWPHSSTHRYPGAGAVSGQEHRDQDSAGGAAGTSLRINHPLLAIPT